MIDGLGQDDRFVFSRHSNWSSVAIFRDYSNVTGRLAGAKGTLAGAKGT